MAADEKVIHSSLKEVKRIGLDSEFPGYPPSIGVIVRLGRFGGNHLAIHTPKITSLVTGESLECDYEDLDSRLRNELLSCAESCRSLSADLLSHATRLDLEAGKVTLIHDSGPDSESESEVESESGSSSRSPDKIRASRADSRTDYDSDLDIFG